MHTMLVTEDADSLPSEVHDVLVRRGHSVTSTTSLEIATAVQRVAPADILVLDWSLAKRSPPSVNEEFFRAAHGDGSALLALVHSETDDLERALDAGANDYLTLPLSTRAIEARIAIVERWLEQRRVDREPDGARPSHGPVLDIAFRAVLDACPDPVCMHRDRKILYANPALVRSLRYESPASMVGIPIVRLVHQDDLAAVEERLATVDRTGKPVPMREERFLAHDGSVRIGEAHSFPVRLDGGSAIVTVGRDVTEMRAFEAQFRHSERLVTVGTIAASIAHELNNPLTLVLCNLAELSSTLPTLAGRAPVELVTRLEQRVHAMEEGAEQIRALARDLTDFARATEARSEPIDLRRVVERAVRLVDAHAKGHAGVAIETELEDVGHVLGSETRLLQVFLNLLINSVDALASAPAGAPRRIVVRLARQGDDAVVTVTDTGPGIPEAMRGHIFEPFFSTKPLGQGTGLGLPVAKMIVEGLHGRIALVDSDAGTTFEVRVPLARSEEASG